MLAAAPGCINSGPSPELRHKRFLPDSTPATGVKARIDVANAVLAALAKLNEGALRELRQIPRLESPDGEDIEMPRLISAGEYADIPLPSRTLCYLLASIPVERTTGVAGSTRAGRRRRKKGSRRIRARDRSPLLIVDPEELKATKLKLIVVIRPEISKWAAAAPLHLGSVHFCAAAVLLRRNWKRGFEGVPVTSLPRLLHEFTHHNPLQSVGRPPASFSKAKLTLSAEWFVRTHVMEERALDVAKAAFVSGPAVNEAIRWVARYLSVRLRTSPRGRPPRQQTTSKTG